MNYNIEMQTAGLILVIAVSISYIFSKKEDTLQFKIYPIHLAIEFIFLILDIASTISVAERFNHPILNEIFARSYIIVLNFWVSVAIIYSMSFTVTKNSGRTKRLIFKYFTIIGIVIPSILGIYTIFGDLRYAGSGRHIYSYHGPSDACYIFSAVCVTLIVIYIILNNGEMTKYSKVPLYSFIAVQSAAGIIQKLNPQLLVIGFGSALCEFIIFRSLENSREEEIQHQIIRSFAETIESRDEETGNHIERTSNYVRIILENLRKNKKYRHKITKEYINMMTNAASLHDVGKLSISDKILHKTEKLTPEDEEIIKTHTIKGATLIENSFCRIGSTKFLKTAKEVALYHHERWDGSGYPFGLKGTGIPISARIMSVADTLDSLTHDKVYRKAISMEEALKIVEENSGTQFAPEIVEAMILSKEKLLNYFKSYNEACKLNKLEEQI